jgi:MFS family permease
MRPTFSAGIRQAQASSSCQLSFRASLHRSSAGSAINTEAAISPRLASSAPVRMKDKVLLCALLAVVGLFLALTFPPIMAEISSVVEAKEKSMLTRGHPGFGKGGAYAQAYALFNVAFAGGCMVGPLLAGFIVEDRGWATMALVLGLLSAIAAVPTCLWLGGWIFKKQQ